MNVDALIQWVLYDGELYLNAAELADALARAGDPAAGEAILGCVRDIEEGEGEPL